jgi:hypothetical protein
MENDPSTALKIISTDPSYVPNKECQQEAKDFLEKVYPSLTIQSILNDKIEFVGQGQNFESAVCPLCENNIETEYWQDAMDKADQSHFIDLFVLTPGCQKMTSLNELMSFSPAEFAKFMLSVDDPETEIKAMDVSAPEEILNTQLRIIYAHY